jgi:histidine ammonia-lyase
MRAALAAGARMYAVTTGAGFLGATDLPDLSEPALAARQRAMLLGRAVGGPPYLPAEEARAVLVVRLVNLLSGAAGVTPDLCEYVVARLGDRLVPAIPRHAAGAAGEVIALAHAGSALIGEGTVLEDGEPAPAAEALAARGVEPHAPAVKEGIALLAGAPVTVAVAIGRLRAARVLAAHALCSAACAIDALRAPLDPYSPEAGRLAGDPLLADVMARLRTALEGSAAERRSSQAPVSFRVVPQVQAHLERTVERLDEDVRRALAAVTDSPAVTAAGVLSTGGFHAVEVAASLDALAAALVRAAELSGQRLHRLLDRRFSGLPDQLASPGEAARSAGGGRGQGLGAAFIAMHKRATGALHELRRLAAPASVGLADTSLGQEDALAFGLAAGENVRRVEALVREVLACELVACRQAWWLRGAPPATGLAPVAAALGELVEVVEEDRALGGDIERVIRWLAASPSPP